MEQKEINEELFGKKLPQAVEIEAACLGAALLVSHAYHKIKKILSEEDFYKIEHQYIYKAIKKIGDEGNEIDILTVTDKLKKMGELDKIGGPYYLSKLTSNVATEAHIVYHAQIIKEKSLFRKVIFELLNIIKKAYDEENLEVLISLTEKTVTPIQKFINKVSNKNENVQNVINRVIKNIEGNIDENERLLSNTFWDHLIEIKNNETIFIAGLPKHGKTKMIIVLIEALLKNEDVAILHYSMEDSNTKVIKNMAAIKTGIPIQDQVKKNLGQDDFSVLIDAFNQIRSDETYEIKDMKSTIYQVRSDYIDFVKKNNDKKCILVVDNFAHLRDLSKKHTDKEKDEEVSAGFDIIRQESSNIGWSCIIIADHILKGAMHPSRLETGYRLKPNDLVGDQRKLSLLTQLVFVSKPSEFNDLISEESNKPKYPVVFYDKKRDKYEKRKLISRNGILQKLIILEKSSTREEESGNLVRVYIDLGNMKNRVIVNFNLKENDNS